MTARSQYTFVIVALASLGCSSPRGRSGTSTPSAEGGGGFVAGVCPTPTKEALDAAPEWERRCEARDQAACANFGSVLIMSTEASKRARGEHLLRAACRAGEPRACASLATMMATGACGVGQSFDEAIKFADYSCQRGLKKACVTTAIVGAKRGRPGDVEKALAILEGTCAALHGDACFQLGWIAGHPPIDDQARSEQAYRDGCALRSPSSCIGLGYCLVHSDTSERQRSGRAVFEQSCVELHSPEGCDSFAEAIEKGWGAPADHAAATTMYARACQMGSKAGCEHAARAGE